MLQTRVIPVLLLGKMGMVKTIRFKQPRYVGDVVNAVRLFNDKEVDELVVLDIEATAKKRIQFELIEQLASEAFMPLTYGGGITSVEDVAQLLRLGVEKVVLNAALFTHPELLSQIAKRFGASTVIASVDFKKNIWGKWLVYSHNGQRATGIHPLDFCQQCEAQGAGELLLHSIGTDGMMQGYPVEIMQQLASSVSIPVIACGGAGSLQHMQQLAVQSGMQAFAAGSMFIYYGPHKAVLINYPDAATLRRTFDQ